MPVERTQLLGIAKDVLLSLGIGDARDLELNYVKKEGNNWKVGFLFSRYIDFGAKRSGIFEVDGGTGDVSLSALDRFWK